MKKALSASLVVGGLFLAGSAVAAPPVAEQAFTGHGTVTCTDISVTAWTAAYSNATNDRVGIYVTSKSTNTANMVGHWGDSTAPSIPIFYSPIEFKPGISQYHGASKSEVLYLRSLAASAETVCVQEMKQ